MADGGNKPEDSPADVEGQRPAAEPAQPQEVPVRYETPAEQQERLHEERRHRRHRRITEAGVALAALFVSLSVFMVNGALFLRGSEIAMLPPETVLFYRDTGPNGSSLWIAMQARMINAAAADYGDVAVRASVAMAPKRHERGRFRHEALIEPALSPNAEEAAKNCPQGARCIWNTGFYVIKRPRKLLDVPGGTSRSEHLAFLIEPMQCEGEKAFCDAFGGFEEAVSHLRSQQRPVIRMTLTFHFDGEQVVECWLPPDPAQRVAIFDYLVEKGWAEVACVNV